MKNSYKVLHFEEQSELVLAGKDHVNLMRKHLRQFRDQLIHHFHSSVRDSSGKALTVGVRGSNFGFAIKRLSTNP